MRDAVVVEVGQEEEEVRPRAPPPAAAAAANATAASRTSSAPAAAGSASLSPNLGVEFLRDGLEEEATNVGAERDVEGGDHRGERRDERRHHLAPAQHAEEATSGQGEPESA